jgi:hypothetical protein
MLDILKKGRDNCGFVAVKAEFEAEGTRPDEFLRLLHLAHCTDLKVALKIGGCEAVSDLFASQLYGVDYIVAPMIETPYALKKFVEATEKTHVDNEGRVEFLYNLETQTALENLQSMMPVAQGHLDGIVFGRVDFVLSRGMPRGAINDPAVTEAVRTVARGCAQNGLDLVVGGSITPAAIDALRAIRHIRLDRFETRKVVFDASVVEKPCIEDAIAMAVNFELLWLENKRDYYARIGAEDAPRIGMMQERQSTLRR